MQIGESVLYRILAFMEVLRDNRKVLLCPRVLWLQSKLRAALGVQVSNIGVQ
jgi:hypothetical protein